MVFNDNLLFFLQKYKPQYESTIKFIKNIKQKSVKNTKFQYDYKSAEIYERMERTGFKGLDLEKWDSFKH